MISLSDRVENIVGKGENGGYQHFLIFRVVKSRDCVVNRQLFTIRQNFTLLQVEAVADHKINVKEKLKFIL